MIVVWKFRTLAEAKCHTGWKMIVLDQSPAVLGKFVFIFYDIALFIPEMATELCSVFSYVLFVT